MLAAVGVMKSFLKELHQIKSSMEEVVVVDIDANKVFYPEGMNDRNLLPAAYAQPLLTTIESISKTLKSGRMPLKLKKGGKKELKKEDKTNLANAFIGFMVDLLATYRNFLIASDDGDDPERRNWGFRKDQFLASVNPESRPLLNMVTETQMFSVFIENRARRHWTTDGAFERGVTRKGTIIKGVNDRPPVSSGSDNAESQSKSQSQAPVAGRGPQASPLRSNRMAAASRFTMYENGTISRSEITAILREEEKKETNGKKKEKVEKEESLEQLRKMRSQSHQKAEEVFKVTAMEEGGAKVEADEQRKETPMPPPKPKKTKRNLKKSENGTSSTSSDLKKSSDEIATTANKVGGDGDGVQVDAMVISSGAEAQKKRTRRVTVDSATLRKKNNVKHDT
jgi:hypothetical protein